MDDQEEVASIAKKYDLLSVPVVDNEGRLVGIITIDDIIDIIDEEALIRVAREGKIRAILDVFEEEPLPLNSGLRGMENVILLPHCGGPTIDKRCDAARLVLDDILRLQRNEPLQNEIVAARAATMSNT
jgi:CBS domain-containing protein